MENRISREAYHAEEAEAGNKEYAKQEWFDAYYRGNALIPQEELGARLQLAITAIGDDPDFNWKDFLNSKLSQKQVEFIGTAMSRMHRSKGVSVSTAGEAEKFKEPPRKIVNEERLRQIWGGSTDRVMILAMKYLEVPGDYMEVDQRAAQLDEMFNDPKNAEKMEYLRKALRVVKEVFEKSEVKEVLKRYRETFSGEAGSEEVLDSRAGYLKEFKDMAIAELEKELGSPLPENLVQPFFV